MRTISVSKLLAAVLALLLLLPLAAVPARAMSGYDPSFELTAEAAYVVNLDTNLVVYEKTARPRCSRPASPNS